MGKTFPFIKQPDAMDCGVCCLKMIASYYNRNYHIDDFASLYIRKYIENMPNQNNLLKELKYEQD